MTELNCYRLLCTLWKAFAFGSSSKQEKVQNTFLTGGEPTRKQRVPKCIRKRPFLPKSCQESSRTNCSQSVAKTTLALTLGGSHVHIKTKKSHQAQRDPGGYSLQGSWIMLHCWYSSYWTQNGHFFFKCWNFPFAIKETDISWLKNSHQIWPPHRPHKQRGIVFSSSVQPNH